MTLNFVSLLIYLIFSVPLVSGVLILACKKCHAKRVFLFTIGISLAGLSGLQFVGEQAVLTPHIFMGEPITFDISTTALRLCLLTVLALSTFTWRFIKDKTVPLTRYQLALINFSISFGFIAFISGQFMIRYIALDIVGLLAAMTVLRRFRDSVSIKPFVFIFQMLRLGDLSLLASILLLNHSSGTLDIPRMIMSAVELPIQVRTWVLAGFVFAILIKTAVWPFGLWMRRARQPEGGPSFWIPGFLMPVLGYYLLYRIQPIIASEPYYQNLVLALAMVLLSLNFLVILLRRVEFEPFTHLNSFMSCFLLAAFAYGAGPFVVYWMMGLIIYRLVVFAADRTSAAFFQYAVVIVPLALNLSFIGVSASLLPGWFTAGWVFFTFVLTAFTWVLVLSNSSKVRSFGMGGPVLRADAGSGGMIVEGAVWLNQTMEMGLLTRGFYWLSDFFVQLGVFFQRNVEQNLERVWSWIGEKLISISEDTLSTVEVDAAEKTGELFDSALNSLAIYEQNVLKKTLRWDLALIPIVLAAILVLLFVL